MKKINLSVILFLLLISIASAAENEYEYISESDILTASLINQDPDPAIAGNIVELRIGVENWGSSYAEGYDLEILLEYPFEPVPGEEYVKSTGTLQGFQTEHDQKILKFKIRTDREVTEGSYDLDLLLYKSGQKNVAGIKKTLSVDINNRESAEVIYIDKVKLVPGQQTPVEFTINNVGAAPLRDMSFSWSNEDDVLLPVGSSDTKYVKYLGIGEKTTITYDVIADTNADPGLYKIELSLTYEDPVTGEMTEITNNAGVYVGGETDFDVSFSESSSGDISFAIANIGSNPAYSVSVRIPKQPGWTTSGSNSAIIGNLNKGDYTVASFELQSATQPSGDDITTTDRSRTKEDSTAPERKTSTTADTPLKVEIAYTDTMGNRNIIKKDVDLNPSMLSSTTSSSRTGMQKTSSTDSLTTIGYYAFGIVVLIGAFVGYRKYKKRTVKNKK